MGTNIPHNAELEYSAEQMQYNWEQHSQKIAAKAKNVVDTFIDHLTCCFDDQRQNERFNVYMKLLNDVHIFCGTARLEISAEHTDQILAKMQNLAMSLTVSMQSPRDVLQEIRQTCTIYLIKLQ